MRADGTLVIWQGCQGKNHLLGIGKMVLFKQRIMKFRKSVPKGVDRVMVGYDPIEDSHRIDEHSHESFLNLKTKQ